MGTQVQARDRGKGSGRRGGLTVWRVEGEGGEERRRRGGKDEVAGAHWFPPPHENGRSDGNEKQASLQLKKEEKNLELHFLFFLSCFLFL